MVYIYKKTIGNKEYYYLRASVRKNNKIMIKDIAYLGSDINTIRDQLSKLPKKYSEEIKKTYKTINVFLEVNKYLNEAKSLKLKKDLFLDKNLLESVESCKIHWNNVFLKHDSLTNEEILKNFIIEFAFNTTGMEGNTISLEQAHKLLTDNLTPKNKTLREIYDLQNTEKVFLKLYHETSKEISHELIIKIHDSLLENIDMRKGYRTQDVRIFKANFKSTPAPYVKADMDLLLKWYNNNKEKLHPFVLATIFHHKLEKIHPFMDGNGRTGRMLMNYILIKNNYPPIIIRKKNRITYLEKLHDADKSELTKNNAEDYTPIITFNAQELTDNYWNLFL